MGVDRFFCPDLQVGRICRLDGDEARHLARVRRVGVGAEVEVFDGRGTAARAKVVRVGRDQVEIRVGPPLSGALVAPIRLTLAVAIPKGDRFDWLIEKATELGVDRVVPLVTERSSVDPRATKLERLRRAVVESCKQCRRNTLMTIDEPTPWEAWAARRGEPTARRWVAHPTGNREWVAGPLEPGAQVVVAIGPEGGFADGEIELAGRAGWDPIALTSTILRIETAALAVAAHLMLRATAGPG